MASILPEALESRHLPLPETTKRQAKAQLRKPEPADFQAQIAHCVTRARLMVGWSKKELAAAVDKDEAQVIRWESGKERPQFDALWSVKELRTPLVIALAELAEGVSVQTVITVRRIA
jgi:ribosome-binding protein aMBF1 (putative translation factor)